jgi:hypothetical protein
MDESPETVVRRGSMGGFDVYDIGDGVSRTSTDSLRSRTSKEMAMRTVGEDIEDTLGMGVVMERSNTLGLGTGVPMERSNTVKFVDSIKPVNGAPPPGILVFSSPTMDEQDLGALSFRMPPQRPRSAAGQSDGGDTPEPVIGAGIPFQRYHSRAISFEVPDRVIGDGTSTSGRRGSRRNSMSGDARSVSSNLPDDESPNETTGRAFLRFPSFARSRSMGGEAAQASRPSSTWSPRQFFNSLSLSVGLPWLRRGSSGSAGAVQATGDPELAESSGATPSIRRTDSPGGASGASV